MPNKSTRIQGLESWKLGVGYFGFGDLALSLRVGFGIKVSWFTACALPLCEAEARHVVQGDLRAQLVRHVLVHRRPRARVGAEAVVAVDRGSQGSVCRGAYLVVHVHAVQAAEAGVLAGQLCLRHQTHLEGQLIP